MHMHMHYIKEDMSLLVDIEKFHLVPSKVFEVIYEVTEAKF